jgi:hypothetical protein
MARDFAKRKWSAVNLRGVDAQMESSPNMPSAVVSGTPIQHRLPAKGSTSRQSVSSEVSGTETLLRSISMRCKRAVSVAFSLTVGWPGSGTNVASYGYQKGGKPNLFGILDRWGERRANDSALQTASRAITWSYGNRGRKAAIATAEGRKFGAEHAL